MHVYSGKEALELLLSSDRIYEDLTNELENKEFHQDIIIREWMEIPVEHEYRGFVYQKKLNAISQYYHTCYFSHLKEEFPLAVERIKEYFNKKLVDVIPLESYIIDFGLLQDRTIVIELNPFSVATDPTLFSWKEDITILEQGPFTTRKTLQPLPITKGVEAAIQDLLNVDLKENK